MQIENFRSLVRRVVARRGRQVTVLVAVAVGIAVMLTPSAHGIRPTQTPAAPAATTAAEDGPTTIVIVRHAEKATDDPRDPTLSDAGRARSKALVAVLADAEVSAVYSTQFKRTRETGAPLAERFGLTVTVRPVTGANATEYAESLAREVLGKVGGKTVVVVGHSNTVPELVKAFGGKPVDPLTEEDYDRLFILVRPASGPARLFQTRYGSPGVSRADR